IRDRNVTGVQTCALPILEYRYEQDILNKLESIAEHLPLLVSFGDRSDGQQQEIDYLATARQLLGAPDGGSGISEAELAAISERADEIQQRIEEREDEIAELLSTPDEEESDPAAGDEATSPAGEAPHRDVPATAQQDGNIERESGEQ